MIAFNRHYQYTNMKDVRGETIFIQKELEEKASSCKLRRTVRLRAMPNHWVRNCRALITLV